MSNDTSDTTQTVHTPLADMFGIFIDIDIPTGRKTNLAEDLKLTQAPPEKLKISLGQKPTFDPTLVKGLNTLRSQANRACSKIGIRFMGGYAVPKANEKDVLSELADVKKEFEAASDDFFSKYPDEVQKWADQAGEYADAFRGAADSLDVVKAKTKFRIFTYPLGEASLHAEEEGTHDGLVSQLYHEISVDAVQLWRESFHTKASDGSGQLKLRSEATMAIVRPFDRIRSKLDGLSFIDPTISRVVGRIDEVLAVVRAAPKVEGAPLMALQGLCCLLKDEQMIRAFAEGADDPAANLFLGSMPSALDDQAQDSTAQLPMVVNGSTVASPAPITQPLVVSVPQSNPPDASDGGPVSIDW